MKTKISLLVVSGLVVIYMFFSAPLIQADTFIQAKRHTDSFTMMGQTQPAKDEVTTMWVAKDKYRTDVREGQSFIVRLDQSKMYVLDHTEKMYSAVDLPIDWSKMIPPESQQMAEQWMQMFKMTATVTDTGETKKIKGWNCRKYLVSLKGMMRADMEVWTTKDIKIDYSAYKKFGESVMSMNPMFKDAMEEMKKIEGYTVSSATTMNMMGADMKTTEEVIEVSEKPAPRGVYDIPAGYKEVPYNLTQHTKVEMGRE